MPIANNTVPASEGEWECMECGYVVEGMSNRRPKSCPECQAPGSDFEFFEFDDDWGDDDFDDDLDDDFDDDLDDDFDDE